MGKSWNTDRRGKYDNFKRKNKSSRPRSRGDENRSGKRFDIEPSEN